MALFEAEQGRLVIEQTRAEARINREIENLKRLREIELTLRRNRLKNQTDLVATPQVDPGVQASFTTFGAVPEYTLIRESGGKYASAVVDENAMLRRGDILRVELVGPISTSAGATNIADSVAEERQAVRP